MRTGLQLWLLNVEVQTFSGVQIPDLEFTDVIFGVGMGQQFKIIRKAEAHVELAGPIGCLSAGKRVAHVLIRRDIER